MKTLCILLLAVFACSANAETVADSTDSTNSAATVVGVYEYTTPPGFPYPGTSTISLSSDQTFRCDMSLSQGKMAAFIGTWSYKDGKVIAVTNERLLEEKPYPSTDPNGWKPGHEMHLYIVGNKLYKSKNSEEPFIKVSK
jgi:hypothetical protein